MNAPNPNAVELCPETYERQHGGEVYGTIYAQQVNAQVLVRLDKSQNYVWFQPEQIRRMFTR